MQITVDKFPASIDEFLAVRDKIATTAEGAAVVFALALSIYGKDQAMGLAALTIAAEKSRLSAGDAYKGFTLMNSDYSLLKSQIEKAPHIGNSYVQGTSFETGYELPVGVLTFDVNENPSSGDRASGKFKVFIRSTGADFPRPVTVWVNDKGLWKAQEWSSLIVGVKAPLKKVSDDL